MQYRVDNNVNHQQDHVANEQENIQQALHSIKLQLSSWSSAIPDIRIMKEEVNTSDEEDAEEDHGISKHC